MKKTFFTIALLFAAGVVLNSEAKEYTFRGPVGEFYTASLDGCSCMHRLRDVKRQIERRYGIPVKYQRFSWGGDEFVDDDLFMDHIGYFSPGISGSRVLSFSPVYRGRKALESFFRDRVSAEGAAVVDTSHPVQDAVFHDDSDVGTVEHVDGPVARLATFETRGAAAAVDTSHPGSVSSIAARFGGTTGAKYDFARDFERRGRRPSDALMRLRGGR